MQATTHPFHYDSICLNGLGCDLAVPAGDRTLADFFAIDYNPATGGSRSSSTATTRSRTRRPGTSRRRWSSRRSPGRRTAAARSASRDTPSSRTSSTDPTGDALSNYSLTAPAVAPPDPPTKNEAAADFTSTAIGPDAATGGFTVTLGVADLSTAALTQALADTGGQSLLWVWRFANGYQDAAASARWNPAPGFTFGCNDYATGGDAVRRRDERAGREVRRLSGRRSRSRGRSTRWPGRSRSPSRRPSCGSSAGPTRDGRPLEQPAAKGARFYDGTAFSFANTTGATQDTQSFLYTLDNTPAMDFLLP